jgi:transcriptional regulator with XRE-family HTH domain
MLGMGVDFAKIKRLREDNKLTQDEAARKAGFKSRQAWNNVERGRQSPTVDTLERIAKALGVKAKDLLK